MIDESKIKPTCQLCGDVFETKDKVLSHIHKKHGNHACQNSFMVKHNLTCHSKKIMPLDPTLEFTPCVVEHKNKIDAVWGFRHESDTHCFICFHDDKLGNNCDCRHCMAFGNSNIINMMR